ncbi:MAG: glycosyltransferase family 2 protein [Ruminococcus sp.]|nr:glycosyltransferase family 2 protein [Ruminococcus sp.]
MLEIIGIALIILGVIYLLLVSFIVKFNNNYPKKTRERLENFAIIIPARDESRVIEDLIKSIKLQTKKVNMQDVYIIVEDKNDKTVEIAKSYGAQIFIRKRLDLKSKGYALDELITYLSENNVYYDAYFIFDADNVLDKCYLERIEETYKKGYDIGIGYRNLKNGNDSLIAASSGITFAFLNSNGNETKSRESRNIVLSGTGFYISGDIIKDLKCFPFHSLTEDYELTLYSIMNNLTSYYNKDAIFYDEQPIKYKDTINQRIRWVKGYFTNRFKYIPKFYKRIWHNPNFGSTIAEIMGMKPYILMIIGAILYILNQVIIMIKIHKLNFITYICLKKIFLIIFLAYFLFMMMTFFVIYNNKGKLNLSMSMRIKTIFFSPIFFVTYIPCALKALFIKDVKWDKVKHTRRFQLDK